MIRYPITLAELEQRIDAVSPTWRRRAARRTAAFGQQGKYEESSSIWGEIKRVYMDLQHNKCAYCERRLAGAPYGPIEHDVEHFRPKSSVKKWPTEAIREQRNLNYPFPTGEAWPEGYYLLAYNPLNYATACKPCNTLLKLNYFPIYGPRRVQSDNFEELAAEQPLLMYPLDFVDDDPQELITFVGILAIPQKALGYDHDRARVTIDFFDLNGREDLRRGRAEQIAALWLALVGTEQFPSAQNRALAERAINRLTAPSSPHCACTRSFYALYRQDRPAAEALYQGVAAYLDSV